MGAALSDVGRVDDLTAFHLHQQGTTRALADAGLSKHDVDGFGSAGLGNLAPVEVAEYLGLRPNWVDGTMVGGSLWEVMVEHATAAIAMRQAEVVVLAYGSTARADLKRRRRTAVVSQGALGPSQFDAPFGHTLISRYAMAARRHMHEYGTSIEQLAEIAVAARMYASMNPDAYHRDPITIDDVQSSPMIADPLTKLHCCVRSDGGGAIVLTSEERARDLAKRPVWVLGTGSAVSHTTMSEWDDFTLSPAARSGPLAFQRAGISPTDIDVAQIYDSFTITVLMTLEALGFCKPGEGGSFVETGALRPGGTFPLNTDGGGLSACHPGMRGMFLLVEAVRQLRGEAGPAQVPGAELAVAHGTGGWFSSASTVVLGVD